MLRSKKGTNYPTILMWGRGRTCIIIIVPRKDHKTHCVRLRQKGTIKIDDEKWNWRLNKTGISLILL